VVAKSAMTIRFRDFTLTSAELDLIR
jgi:hypothetical protein